MNALGDVPAEGGNDLLAHARRAGSSARLDTRIVVEQAKGAAAYRFLDRWVVSAPIERVYDTIGEVLGYER